MRARQRDEFVDLSQRVAILEDLLERNRVKLVNTVQFVDALQERLLIVDDLPVEAPLGALMRRRNGTLAERATLYMGNGVGKPITKLPAPTAV